MERVIDCPCGKDKDSCFEEVQENFSSFNKRFTLQIFTKTFCKFLFKKFLK